MRGLGKLTPTVARRVAAAIDALAEEPRPSGVKRLQGRLRGVYRLRLGDYRVLYTIDDAGQTVEVVGIGHRSRMYD